MKAEIAFQPHVHRQQAASWKLLFACLAVCYWRIPVGGAPQNCTHEVNNKYPELSLLMRRSQQKGGQLMTQHGPCFGFSCTYLCRWYCSIFDEHIYHCARGMINHKDVGWSHNLCFLFYAPANLLTSWSCVCKHVDKGSIFPPFINKLHCRHCYYDYY